MFMVSNILRYFISLNYRLQMLQTLPHYYPAAKLYISAIRHTFDYVGMGVLPGMVKPFLSPLLLISS